MARALETMVTTIVNKTLQDGVPQGQVVMLAKVTRSAKQSETYEISGLQVEDTEEGRTYEATLTGYWYEYTLQILTKDRETDSQYPPIPGVISTVQAEPGACVAVIMLYGELKPYILGEVK
ncbi:hypothetical protein [Hungatella effluvii]|uniref:hypothetical protein n=1 Tax=Hungatella effluvii TaxID=1096246 RepID=UPI0022E740EF|nr:hypothetical protein [Hungatella effluvii]